MKLALALFKYFPYGGLQRNFLAIARELMDRGHQVTVYTGHWEGEQPTGLRVVKLPSRGISNPGRNRSFHRQLRVALDNDPHQLLVGFNKMPGLDVYYCADTCFATRVNEDKSWLERLTPRVRWSLRYEAAIFDSRSNTEILLLSQAEGEAYRRCYGTQQARLHLMPPGINRDRVRGPQAKQLASAMREQLGLAPEQRALIFLGSDYKRKGLDRALRALASLPQSLGSDCVLLVVGRDKRQPRYEKLAVELGVAQQTHFLGQRDDIPALLFCAELLMHPAYLENTGNVIVESLVAGAPVICSGTCGYAGYVQDSGMGAVITEPFCQETMNKALQNLLIGPRNWHHKGATFAASADVFSRPLRAAETIERMATRCK